MNFILLCFLFLMTSCASKSKKHFKDPLETLDCSLNQSQESKSGVQMHLDPPSVVGKVLLNPNKGALGIRIKVKLFSKYEILAETCTNEQGSFEFFDKLNNGHYLVSIDDSDWKGYLDFEITPNKHSDLKVIATPRIEEFGED